MVVSRTIPDSWTGVENTLRLFRIAGHGAEGLLLFRMTGFCGGAPWGHAEGMTRFIGSNLIPRVLTVLRPARPQTRGDVAPTAAGAAGLATRNGLSRSVLA